MYRKGSGAGLLAAAVLIAGCGSTTVVTVTKPVPAATHSSATAQTTTRPGTTTAAPAGTTTATPGGTTTAAPAGTTTAARAVTTPAHPSLPPARTVVHVATFRSPSANIGCMIIDAVARCDIRHRGWSPPPHPSSCPKIVDYGQGLTVGHSGPGRFVCAGDTTLDPHAQVLAYGTATRTGGFYCLSATSRMTCTNTSTGHGFSLAIQGYRVF